jgi:ABC-type uncharacterized transport system ATPase subunit
MAGMLINNGRMSSREERNKEYRWQDFSIINQNSPFLVKIIKIILIDECTSAVSKDIEEGLYRSGRKLGITLITVTHKVE